MKKLYLLILLLIPFVGSAQNETADGRNGLVVYPNPTTGKFRIHSS